MNKYLKVLLIMLAIAFITCGVVYATAEANAKTVKDTKKVSKDKFIKFKVVKQTKSTLTIIVDGKNQTLKRVYMHGRYSPHTVYKNKFYIATIGARGTNGGSPKPAGLRVFENRITSKKTGKPVSGWGDIQINPKRVSDGEFTFKPKGHHIYKDGDYCTQTGREKWYSQRTYMKRVN